MNYKSLIFDCDGVILDSNKLKTQAFYQSSLPYGEAAAHALVDYHVRNGGVSRYRKFEYFLQAIVGHNIDSDSLKQLLSDYAAYVREGLLSCTIAPGLQQLRQRLPHTRWLVVSGSDQTELRDIFSKRSISYFFDGGIFGSPDTKDEILARELDKGTIQKPAVFLGDSHYDYLAATRAGLDFIFITGWSEMNGWEDFCKASQLQYVKSISDLKSNFF